MIQYRVERYNAEREEWQPFIKGRGLLRRAARRMARRVRRSRDTEQLLGKQGLLLTVKYDVERHKVTGSYTEIGRMLLRQESRAIAEAEEADREAEQEATPEPDDNKTEAIRHLRRFSENTSGLDRLFSQTPKLCRCSSCGHYFAIPGPRRDTLRCPVCRSGQVKIKAKG